MNDKIDTFQRCLGKIKINKLYRGSKFLLELRDKNKKGMYDFYVYYHIKDEKIIYVGKGKVKTFYGEEDYRTDSNQRCFSNAGRNYDIKKYIDEVVIVDFYKNEHEALEKEEHLTKMIKEYATWKIYNIDDGNMHTAISKKKSSESHKGLLMGEKNPMYGRNWREEKTKEELETINKKIKKTWNDKGEEEKMLYSDKCRERTLGDKNPMYGRKHTPETRVKCGEKNKVKIVSVDVLGNMKEYDSIKEASTKSGADSSSIIRVCRGRQKTANNMVWFYEDDIYFLYYEIDRLEKEEQ